MILRFESSAFDSLRTFVNYGVVTDVPLKIFVATLIGIGTGLLGGLIGVLGRREARSVPRLF